MNDKKSARFSSVPCPPRDVLILAAWFVLLTCLGDIGMQAIRKLMLHSNFYWRAHRDIVVDASVTRLDVHGALSA